MTRITMDMREPVHPNLPSSPCHASLLTRIWQTSAREDEVWMGCSDGTLWHWRGEWRFVVSWPNDQIVSLVLGEGDSLWAANRTGFIERIDERSAPLSLDEDIVALMRRLEGSPYILVRGQERVTRLFDSRTGRWVLSLPDLIRAIAISDSGTLWVVRDQRLEAWKLPDTITSAYYTNGHGFSAITWSADERSIAGVNGAGEMHLFSPGTSSWLTPLRYTTAVGKHITASPVDGSYTLGSVGGSFIHHVSARDGQLIMSPAPHAPEGQVRRVAVTATGAIVAAHYESGIYWSARHGEPYTLRFGEDIWHDLEMSRDGRQMLLIGQQSVARWESDGDRVRVFKPELEDKVIAGARSHDGKIALLTRQFIHIYTARDAFMSRWQLSPPALDVVWRPGHDQVITGHMDGSIKVWNLAGKLLAEWRPHEARVSSLAVTHDGERLASGSWDGTMQSHALTPLDLSAEQLRESLPFVP